MIRRTLMAAAAAAVLARFSSPGRAGVGRFVSLLAFLPVASRVPTEPDAEMFLQN